MSDRHRSKAQIVAGFADRRVESDVDDLVRRAWETAPWRSGCCPEPEPEPDKLPTRFKKRAFLETVEPKRRRWPAWLRWRRR
jgi:hypothetical protein